MSKPIIANIEQDRRLNFYLTEAAEESGFEVENIEYAVPALEAITTKTYDIITMGLWMCPGQENMDPQLEKVWKHANRHGPPVHDYWEVTLHLIKRARTKDSPNENTPIFIYTTCTRDRNLNGVKAEDMFLKAGANGYFHSIDTNLYDMVEQFSAIVNTRT